MSATGFLIALAPLALLLVLLCIGCYPGEKTIGKLRLLIETVATGIVRKLSPGGRLSNSPPNARGGRLIASSLAGRGPPIDR